MTTTMTLAPWPQGVFETAVEPARSRGRGPSGTLGAPLPRACRQILADAHRELEQAMRAGDMSDRFAGAHLAALRGAAAVLAARARPRRSARGSAWDLLARHSPDLAEWAAYFAAEASRRQAVVAGIAAAVVPRDADDMVRAAAEFLELVEAALAAGRGR